MPLVVRGPEGTSPIAVCAWSPAEIGLESAQYGVAGIKSAIIMVAGYLSYTAFATIVNVSGAGTTIVNVIYLDENQQELLPKTQLVAAATDGAKILPLSPATVSIWVRLEVLASAGTKRVTARLAGRSA